MCIENHMTGRLDVSLWTLDAHVVYFHSCSHLTIMMCLLHGFVIFFCRHVWTVILVTMQPISNDIKSPCRCRQVQKDPLAVKKVFSNSANVRYMCMPRSISRVHVYSVNDSQGHLKVKFRQSWRPLPSVWVILDPPLVPILSLSEVSMSTEASYSCVTQTVKWALSSFSHFPFTSREAGSQGRPSWDTTANTSDNTRTVWLRG